MRPVVVEVVTFGFSSWASRARELRRSKRLGWCQLMLAGMLLVSCDDTREDLQSRLIGLGKPKCWSTSACKAAVTCSPGTTASCVDRKPLTRGFCECYPGGTP